MKSKLICSSLIAVTTFVATTSCRSARRGVRVGADSASLEVAMTGLAQQDKSKENWIYELSGCLPPINGALGADDKVTFTAIGLKAGLEDCQFRVKTLQAAATIKFVEGSEPNVLYWARAVRISQDAAGKLIAEAPLQKLFEIVTPSDARKTFTLKVPVKLSKADERSPVTAAIQCTPEVANLGKFNRTDGQNGTVWFTLPIEAEMQYACTEMYLSIAGDLHLFKGSFTGENGRFAGSVDKEVVLSPLDMIFQASDPGTNQGDSNVSVSTKGEECNSEDKYFDVATGECKKK